MHVVVGAGVRAGSAGLWVGLRGGLGYRRGVITSGRIMREA
jgi:hypothetical protein